MNNDIKIYQTEEWEIKVNVDLEKETIRLNLNQIAELFWRDKSTISRHIKKIFKTWELNQKQTVAIFTTVQNEWWKQVKRDIEYYNLDMIISIWYRVDSKQATNFRIWATSVLKDYITKGFVLNEKRLIEKKYDNFLQAVNHLESLVKNKNIKADEIISLIKDFWNTWFDLENFDKWNLPEEWFTQKDLKILANELSEDVEKLKQDLIKQDLATEMFAQEKTKWALEWIYEMFGLLSEKKFIQQLKKKHHIYYIL